MPERPSHKLVVILHADVVGSTVLVQHDETVAHRRIQDSFRRFSDTIEAYGGVAHEIRGDALVAEFDRASDAVCAGIAFQADNSQVNATLEDDVRPEVRIGISMGEVVIADNTITGAGVVLAQRLEQLADPGGMCIQDAAYQSVPKRLPVEYESLGEQEIKGFEEPVRAYRVALKSGMPVPPPGLRSDTRETKPVWRRVAGAVVVLLIVVGGGFAWIQPWKPEFEPASVERMAFPLPDKPSIAVLPFTNMSGDAEQEYFVDGMTEDLITDLSKLSGVFVIARNSTFTYKGKPVKVRQVAEELGVRYVLEGSVRRAGDQVRINAQLIDATTGGHLWAERYDGSLADVFALQDRVTQKIVSALAVELAPNERAALEVGGTSNLQAHEAFLRGIRHLNVRDEVLVDENDKARREFEKAIELDPNYATAYAALGLTYWNRWALFDILDAGAKREAFELAARSLELADNAMAHRLLAKKYLFLEHYAGAHGERQHDLAIAELRKAVALEPNNPDFLAELAYYLVFAGDAEEAQALIARAKRLNPNFPSWYYRPSGFVHFMKGDYKSAIPDFTAWLESVTIPWWSAFALASAQAQSGDIAKAQETLQGLRKRLSNTLFANLHLGTIDDYFPFKRENDLERFLEGLRKAGVPDAPQ